MAPFPVDSGVRRDGRMRALTYVMMDLRPDLTPLVAHTFVARLRRDLKVHVSTEKWSIRWLANGEEVIGPQAAPRRLMRETGNWWLSPGEVAAVPPLHAFRVACGRRLCLDRRVTRICHVLRDELVACTRDLGRRMGAMQQAVAECV